jgi:ADP-ribose 1''-phosphate phosphatase
VLGTSLVIGQVICLFTSRGYGSDKDSPEMIVGATESAIMHLLYHYGERKINSPKINSGLFNVPWELTEGVIKKIIPENMPWTVWEL